MLRRIPEPSTHTHRPSITIFKGGISDTSDRPHTRSCTSRNDHNFAVLQPEKAKKHEAPRFFSSGLRKNVHVLKFVHHISHDIFIVTKCRLRSTQIDLVTYQVIDRSTIKSTTGKDHLTVDTSMSPPCIQRKHQENPPASQMIHQTCYTREKTPNIKRTNRKLQTLNGTGYRKLTGLNPLSLIGHPLLDAVKVKSESNGIFKLWKPPPVCDRSQSHQKKHEGNSQKMQKNHMFHLN